MTRFFLIFFLFKGMVANGQSFEAVPDPLYIRTLGFQEANECIIHLENPSGDSLRLRWRLLEFSAPETWQFDICDYGACYGNFPNTGLMNFVYDTIQPYIKLIVQPGLTPGDAWLRYRIFEASDNTNFVDVYFSLFTPGITAASAPSNSDLRVFPNPAQAVLFVDNPSARQLAVSIVSAVGHPVIQATIPAQSVAPIDIQNLQDGLYFLHTATKTYHFLKEN